MQQFYFRGKGMNFQTLCRNHTQLGQYNHAHQEPNQFRNQYQNLL